jgi:hypothetical protein
MTRRGPLLALTEGLSQSLSGFGVHLDYCIRHYRQLEYRIRSRRSGDFCSDYSDHFVHKDNQIISSDPTHGDASCTRQIRSSRESQLGSWQ